MAMGTPAAEHPIDERLVRWLLEDQHSDLAHLPISAAGSGWDNAVFRLGDRLLVRLPRRSAAVPLLENELQWVARLPPLPLPIPAPERAGEPGRGYPWPWSVVRWLPGETAEARPPSDLDAAAADLGGFLAALHQPAPDGAPANVLRGVPLRERAAAVPLAFDGLRTVAPRLDVDGLRRRWRAAHDVPDWQGPSVWVHGDVHPLNLLVDGGVLSGVIDFGDLTAGDPASDLAVAWMLFPPGPRGTFRAALGAHVDADTWERARGWAVALGIAFAHGDERVRGIGTRTLHAVLTDPA